MGSLVQHEPIGRLVSSKLTGSLHLKKPIGNLDVRKPMGSLDSYEPTLSLLHSAAVSHDHILLGGLSVIYRFPLLFCQHT